MELTKIENYDFKNRLLSPVFICLFLLPYYIDYTKLGSGHLYSFDYFSYLLGNRQVKILLFMILHPIIFGAFIVSLFHYSKKIEQSINEPFRKFQVPIYGIVLTVVIIGKAAMFGGNSNKMIMNKLGWSWAIVIILLGMQMFKPSEKNLKED